VRPQPDPDREDRRVRHDWHSAPADVAKFTDVVNSDPERMQAAGVTGEPQVAFWEELDTLGEF
jgi:hypothetical protein